MFSVQKITTAALIALAAWFAAFPGHAGPQDEPERTPREALALAAGGDPVLHDAAMVKVLTNVAPTAVVTSPLHITGIAEGGLFHEGVFPIFLIGEEGCVLAQAPARPLTDWMTGGEVAFEATVVFSAPPGSWATLVFEEDVEHANAPEPLDVRTRVTIAGAEDPDYLVPRREDCIGYVGARLGPPPVPEE
ncbi:MAG TPA: hypothetical protein VF686_01520 [Brevundimonas sp.]|jgi:hypothetical protein